MKKTHISGWGCISAIGSNIQESESSFFAPGNLPQEHGLPSSDTFRSRLPEEGPGLRVGRLLNRAIEEALTSAQLSLDDRKKYKIGVCLGTTSAFSFGNEKFLSDFFNNQCPDLIEEENFLTKSLAEKIAGKYSFVGPHLTINNACTSGADALGIGKLWLDQGACDIVLAGGVDVIPKHIVEGFDSLQLRSPELARPFDKNRCGLNLGEGAGILVLENQDIAVARRQEPLGYLLGVGMASDHYHPSSPDPSGFGLELAIRRCLQSARILPNHVAFLNAHGTATRTNDLTEARVFKGMFEKAQIVSTKGYTGHTLAAAGALEAIFTLMFLRRKLVPATRGFAEADPELGLAPTQSTTGVESNFAISTSLGFGGSNTALVIEGCDAN
ncbi:MAG: beta-ketoacyl-[acyl-carrier-protein] synthase family protein [Oligoflexales bacterium]